jgi:hypothetical protein
VTGVQTCALPIFDSFSELVENMTVNAQQEGGNRVCLVDQGNLPAKSL